MIPVISISGGQPVMLMPLSLVILVSMIKDIFEDYKRHKSDDSENDQEVLVFDSRQETFVMQQWKNLEVGQIVKVFNEQFFPADLVILKSSGPKGVCYVETKNLDGETNLKHKMTEKWLNHNVTSEQSLNLMQGVLTCEAPNDQIYKFEGTYQVSNYNKTIPLGIENLLLRGSSLRNTEWIYGLIVYAGHDSKVMKNSSNAKFKMSKIEKTTNKQIILVFIVQVILCVIAAFIGTFWIIGGNNLEDYWYLNFDMHDSWNTSFFWVWLKSAGTWQLIFTYFYF